jgi:hypothetical protein
MRITHYKNKNLFPGEKKIHDREKTKNKKQKQNLPEL